MHLVVAYDIVNDRTRVKFAKSMSRYLERVQKSVFEGEVDDRIYEEVKKEIWKIINPDEDNVRIYHQCARCKPLTEVFGIGVWIPEEEGDEVI